MFAPSGLVGGSPGALGSAEREVNTLDSRNGGERTGDIGRQRPRLLAPPLAVVPITVPSVCRAWESRVGRMRGKAATASDDWRGVASQQDVVVDMVMVVGGKMCVPASLLYSSDDASAVACGGKRSESLP